MVKLNKSQMVCLLKRDSRGAQFLDFLLIPLASYAFREGAVFDQQQKERVCASEHLKRKADAKNVGDGI